MNFQGGSAPRSSSAHPSVGRSIGGGDPGTMTVLPPDQAWFDVPMRLGDVLHAGRLALARLAELGIATPPDHRLARAVRRVERAFASADRDGSFVIDAFRFSEALRTMLHQYIVGRAVSESDHAAIALIARTLDGRDTPAEDLMGRAGAGTAARDTEFELLAAPHQRLGGHGWVYQRAPHQPSTPPAPPPGSPTPTGFLRTPTTGSTSVSTRPSRSRG